MLLVLLQEFLRFSVNTLTRKTTKQTTHKEDKNMDKDKLLACAQRIAFLQAIHVTFLNNGISGLQRLMQLAASNPAVRIEENQKMGLYAVVQSGQWQSVSRTVMVYGLSKVRPDLLEPIAKDIESLSVGDHFAKGVFTSSPKKKQDAFDMVARTTLSPHFTYEMEGWGVKIEPKLIEIEGLPAVQFNILNIANSNHLFAFVIDGWSGRYGVQKAGVASPAWEDCRFSDSQGVRERIYSAITDYIDLPAAA